MFILALNAPVDRASVLKHAYFEVEGIASRVDATFLAPEEVKRVVNNMYFFDNLTDKPKIGLKAKLAFPAGKKVSLVWGKDIQTASGLKSDAAKDQVFNFTVRPPFTVSLRCRRKDETQGCDPLGDIRLFFSSYVEASKTHEITLSDGKGRPLTPDAGVSGVTRHTLFRPLSSQTPPLKSISRKICAAATAANWKPTPAPLKFQQVTIRRWQNSVVVSVFWNLKTAPSYPLPYET